MDLIELKLNNLFEDSLFPEFFTTYTEVEYTELMAYFSKYYKHTARESIEVATKLLDMD